MWSFCCDWFKLKGEYRYIFKLLLILSVLYVAPIILANYYYVDDLGNSLYGTDTWSDDGRPLVGILFKALNFNSILLDLSPLPLLLGLIIYSYCLVIFSRERLYFSRPIFIVFAMFFCLANPFLVQNLSYKYDAFYMLVALGLSIVMFAIPDKLGCSQLIIFFLTLICLCLYQAVIGGIIGMALIIFLLNIHNHIAMQKATRTLFGQCMVVVLAVLFYKFMIGAYYVTSNYSLEHSSLVDLFALLVGNIDAWKTIIVNITVFLKVFQSGLHSIFPAIRNIAIVLVLLSLGLVIRDYWKANVIGHLGLKILTSICICLLPVLIFLSVFVPLTLLKLPVFAPRVLISFSVFMLFIGILWLFLVERFRLVILFFILCLIFFFSYIYAYGNALYGQKNYEAFIAQSIVYDIERTVPNRGCTKITIVGRLPNAKVVQIAIKRYPLLQHILHSYFDNSWLFSGQLLEHYRQEPVKIVKMTKEDSQLIRTQVPVVYNHIYKMFQIDDRILIEFKDNEL